VALVTTGVAGDGVLTGSAGDATGARVGTRTPSAERA